jgi:hypothetical protein
METMLIQLVRSIVYDNIPSKTEMAKLHTFLNNLDVFEAQHPAHASASLEDWVPRLLDGIATSSRLTIQHPPLMLQASTEQSNHYMDSVLDAIATVPCCHEALTPEPRFTVSYIMGHKIVGEQLSYWVQWEGTDYYEAEVYKNLHHLDVFKQYEISIAPIIGTRARTPRQKAQLESYKNYLRLRDEAISQLTEEFDTEDEGDQVELQQQCYLTGSPMEHISSDDTISWGSLLVAEDTLMPTNLDLGGSFGEAGPSYQGEPFSWRD